MDILQLPRQASVLLAGTVPELQTTELRGGALLPQSAIFQAPATTTTTTTTRRTTTTQCLLTASQSLASPQPNRGSSRSHTMAEPAAQSRAAAGASATALMTLLASFGRASGVEQGMCSPDEEQGQSGTQVSLMMILIFWFGVLCTLFAQGLWRSCRSIQGPEGEEPPQAESQGPRGILTGRRNRTTTTTTSTGMQVSMPPLTALPFGPVQQTIIAPQHSTVHLAPTRVYVTERGKCYHSYSCTTTTVSKRKGTLQCFQVCSRCADKHDFPITATPMTGGSSSSTARNMSAAAAATPQQLQADEEYRRAEADYFWDQSREAQDYRQEMLEGHDSDSNPPNPDDYSPPNSPRTDYTGLRGLDSSRNPTEASASGDEEQG